MDKECYIHVDIKNTGDGIPKHFFELDAPISLSIEKGKSKEALLSLTQFDKQKKLATPGGSFTLKSRNTYQNNSKPLKVFFEFDEEFGDYNQTNDVLEKSLACKKNIGEIDGDPILYTRSDVSVVKANIGPDCRIKARIENLTKVSLTEIAWDNQRGVQLIIKDVDDGEILSRTMLLNVDPDQKFTRVAQALEWRSEPIQAQSPHLSIGVWHVQNDRNFSNNHFSLELPKKCIAQAP